MLRLRKMTDEDYEAIKAAIWLIKRVTPDCYERLMAVADTVIYDPFACGGEAIACTWDRRYRAGVIILRYRPSETEIPELAVTLLHEGEHIGLDDFGDPYKIAHRCRNCQDPWERYNDPIYRRDIVARRIYTKEWEDLRERAYLRLYYNRQIPRRRLSQIVPCR